MTDQQITDAWNLITISKKRPIEIAKDLNIEFNELRNALVEKYGQKEFRDAIQYVIKTQQPDGSKLSILVDKILSKNPTSTELDKIISNFQIATQKLMDAKNV